MISLSSKFGRTWGRSTSPSKCFADSDDTNTTAISHFPADKTRRVQICIPNCEWNIFLESSQKLSDPGKQSLLAQEFAILSPDMAGNYLIPLDWAYYPAEHNDRMR
jgi:hypothetical protein